MCKITDPKIDELNKKKQSLQAQLRNASGNTRRTLRTLIQDCKNNIQQIKKTMGGSINQTNGTPAEARVSRGRF